MNKTNVYGSFILSAVFAVLKLTGVIAWSWWWVTCPLWAPVAVAALLVLVGYAVLRKYGK